MAITKGVAVPFTAANETEIPTYEPNFSRIEGSLGFMMVLSNEFAPRFGTSGFHISYRDNANTYTADQYASARIANPVGGGYMGLLLRATGVDATANFYRGTFSGSDGGRLDITKIVNGAETSLASVLATPFAANDILTFRATGTTTTTLSLFKNSSSTPLLTVNDSSSPHVSGSAGISGRAGSGFEWAMDDWIANDFVGAGISGNIAEPVTAAHTQLATRTQAAPQAEAVNAADTVSATVTTTPPGVFTSEPLKRNNGALAASSPLSYVAFSNPSTGAFVVSKTGLSTNGSGIFSTSDALLVAGTIYRADWLEASGQRGYGLKAAV
jgi:hypothetical protein